MTRNGKTWLLCMVLALCAAVSGCGPEEASGEAQALVTLPQALSASDVARVELTVTGTGMVTRTEALAKTGGVWGGLVGNLPAGTGRTFRGEAFNSANTLIYAGQVTGVTITAGQTTSVTLMLQEVNAPAPFENAAPVITSVVASPAMVGPGGVVALQASAEDPNTGDTLTYAWTAGAGSFTAASSLNTAWTAPTTPGPVVLTLTVTDSKGATAALSLTITVNTGTGRAAVNATVNTWPQVARVTATPSTVAVGQTATVLATASDNDGDGLTYAWTAGCAGTWTHATSASASFTPTAQPPVGNPCATCALTVTVEDGRGGQTTGTLGICVGTPPSALFPPEVVETFQSTPTTPAPGSAVGFRVRARDPQGSALSFAWATHVGTLGTATTAATTSEVVWTAPACVPPGTTPTVTVTVSNALGLRTTSSFTVTGSPVCDTSGWTSVGSLTEARYRHTATLLPSGKVLVAGGGVGYSTDTVGLSSAALYDPATDTWVPTGSLRVGRYGHTATLLPSGKVLVAGGITRDGEALTSAELYDPATGNWAYTGFLSVARWAHLATLLPSGKVLVIGGDGSFSQYAAELYDPARGSWASTGSLSVARSTATATLLPSGKVLVTGGTGGGSTDVELYDPATGTWALAASMTGLRRFHTATLLPSGKVLVTGGDHSSAGATAEVYDPATGTWVPTASMAARRANHTATLLPSGKVLVAGGRVSSTLPEAEVYDPATGTWTPTPSMATRRANHTATLLPSGKVLLTGGMSPNGPTTSTEVYSP